MLKKFSFILLLICISNHVNAQEQLDKCQKMPTATKIAQCMDYLKNKKEQELKVWVKNQILELEEFGKKLGDKSALIMFKRSQQHFNNFREDNCRWKYLATNKKNKPEIEYKICFIQLTQQRINALRQ